MKRVSILGSTGSIGRNTLEVLRHHRKKYQVLGLVAGQNVELLLAQAREFKPKYVSLKTNQAAEMFMSQTPDPHLEVLVGEAGASQIASLPENDIVVSAITGIEGLKPTLAALQAGKRVALANKESMVVAGPFIQAQARRSGAEIIPVDSEHSGIYQCLRKERPTDVRKVILTASGGPFFQYSSEQLATVTLEEALRHPRWKMGKKISVDSATLMNKGLELLEARWLFNLTPEQLGILVHPQSLVHSLVELKDGTLLAQLSPTDMKIPIQYALTAPYRQEANWPSLDLSQIQKLEFYEVDTSKFPLINLARQALSEELSFAVALNGANEEVVQAFLKKKIRFIDLAPLIFEVMERHRSQAIGSLEEIFEVDRQTRELTRRLINQWK
ncbi:MAG TPA: 1-deoxy-D-xylulose-5-phosphate reductoisomerase, partial [Candidatus Aminicenantes bacterium]|nr:1-deoxy-D-xylulose-5-phosphate reductoisomerase [Candidatus Aminicenantes bacterium]